MHKKKNVDFYWFKRNFFCLWKVNADEIAKWMLLHICCCYVCVMCMYGVRVLRIFSSSFCFLFVKIQMFMINDIIYEYWVSLPTECIISSFSYFLSWNFLLSQLIGVFVFSATHHVLQRGAEKWRRWRWKREKKKPYSPYFITIYIPPTNHPIHIIAVSANAFNTLLCLIWPSFMCCVIRIFR